MEKKHISKKEYYVTMPDGSVWSIPVEVIARDRAEFYREEFDNDIERSLNEDTYPLFESDDYEIEDWARNNLNWEDVEGSARLVEEPPPNMSLYQEGWCNPEKDVEIK